MISAGRIKISTCTADHPKCTDVQAKIAGAATRVSMEVKTGAVDHTAFLQKIYGAGDAAALMVKIDTTPDGTIDSREAIAVGSQIKAFFQERTMLPTFGGVYDRFYEYASITEAVRTEINGELKGAPPAAEPEAVAAATVETEPAGDPCPGGFHMAAGKCVEDAPTDASKPDAHRWRISALIGGAGNDDKGVEDTSQDLVSLGFIAEWNPRFASFFSDDTNASGVYGALGAGVIGRIFDEDTEEGYDYHGITTFGVTAGLSFLIGDKGHYFDFGGRLLGGGVSVRRYSDMGGDIDDVLGNLSWAVHAGYMGEVNGVGLGIGFMLLDRIDAVAPIRMEGNNCGSGNRQCPSMNSDLMGFLNLTVLIP